jgi:hypothetical protein
MRVTLCVLLVVLAVPNAASAVTLVTPDGQVAQPYQRWANAAKVPTPNVSVVLMDGGPFASPSAAPSTVDRLATITLGGTYPTALTRRYAFLHELGHIFDFTMLSDSDRATFLATVKRPQWWDTSSKPGGELFADAYAFCALNRRLLGLDEGYGYVPSRHAFRRVCAMVRRAGVAPRND